jgi:hypothetical protein
MFRTAAVLLCVTALFAPAAHAQLSNDASSSANEIAEAWTRLATPTGLFPDYLKGHGTAVPSLGLGYALMASGVRTGAPETIDAGLRAIDYGVTHRIRAGDYGAFDNMAVASAYNLARARLAGNPLFAKHRAAWERFLRRARLCWLPHQGYYANKYLVDGVAALELLRTGLRSRVRGSALASRANTERLARRLVNRVVPAYARRLSGSAGARPAFILSDPSNNALAYHGLSLGFYGRAIELLGPRASRTARATLERAARASWGLMAPDGDVAYIGRSQEQGWALSLTAYGSEIVAQRLPRRGAYYRGVAAVALSRLRRVHPVGKLGFPITPAIAINSRAGVRGLDAYASGVGYSGLTLMALEWMAHDATPGRVGAISAARPERHRLSRGRLQFGVRRAGRVWFAVKRAASIRASDLRYDFGLIAFEARGVDGSWSPVMPLRPHTSGRGRSAGPVLHMPGVRGIPHGTRLRFGARGSIAVAGRWQTSGQRTVRGGMRYWVTPSGCGVEVRFAMPRGATVDYSVFLRSLRRIRRERGVLADGTQVVRFPAAAHVRLKGGFSSGSDPRLTEARLRFGAGRARNVAIAICAR